MIAFDPGRAAADAVAASETRPATAVLFDSADVRLVVFRIMPGQSVAPHHSPSTVTITVLRGEGMLSGRDGEQLCREGEIVAYEPGETHGMRSVDSELHLLAMITPRPGERPNVPALARMERAS